MNMTLKRVGDRPIQYQADTHSNLLDQAVFTVRSVNEAVWDGANQPVTAVLSNYELLFLLEGEALPRRTVTPTRGPVM